MGNADYTLTFSKEDSDILSLLTNNIFSSSCHFNWLATATLLYVAVAFSSYRNVTILAFMQRYRWADVKETWLCVSRATLLKQNQRNVSSNQAIMVTKFTGYGKLELSHTHGRKMVFCVCIMSVKPTHITVQS